MFSPMNTSWMWLHFRLLREVEPEIRDAIRLCNVAQFQWTAHQMQDFFSHRGQGFHTWRDLWINYPFQGHGAATVGTTLARVGGFGVARPDNAEDYRRAYEAARMRTQYWVDRWNRCCVQAGNTWVLRAGITQADLDADPPAYPLGDTAPPPTPAPGYWLRGWNTSVTGISDAMSTVTLTIGGWF
jgi:hypothetical protein